MPDPTSLWLTHELEDEKDRAGLAPKRRHLPSGRAGPLLPQNKKHPGDRSQDIPQAAPLANPRRILNPRGPRWKHAAGKVFRAPSCNSSDSDGAGPARPGGLLAKDNIVVLELLSRGDLNKWVEKMGSSKQEFSSKVLWLFFDCRKLGFPERQLDSMPSRAGCYLIRVR